MDGEGLDHLDFFQGKRRVMFEAGKIIVAVLGDFHGSQELGVEIHGREPERRPLI